jgi:hypothetical protein
MSALQFQYDSLSMVSGLAWQPLNRANARRELTLLAKESGSDLFVMKKRRSIGGLAGSGDGVKAGNIAVGMLLLAYLDTRPAVQNALIAIEVPSQPNTALYFVVRDGFILADGDQHGPTTTIRSSFLSDESAGGWDLLVCPKSWDIDSSESIGLDQLITERITNDSRLAPVQMPPAQVLLRGLAVAAILAAPYFGIRLWQDHQNKELQAAAPQIEVAPPAVTPWSLLPEAVEFTKGCMDNLAKVPIFETPWTPLEMRCEPGRIIVSWVMPEGGAMASELLQTVPGVVFKENAKLAELVMGYAPTPGKSDALAGNAQSETVRLTDVSARYGFSLKVDAPANAAGAALNTDWQSLQIGTSSEMHPVELVKLINGPGLRITSLAARLTEAPRFEIKGTVYVVR